jgi:hypothetical protein
LRLGSLSHRGGTLDLVVHRHGEDISVHIERRQGDIELRVTI